MQAGNITMVALRDLSCSDTTCPQVHHRLHRGSWIDDSLLAAFTLTLTALFLALFARMFSWQAMFAMLMVPTLLLSSHTRYRAAAIAAGIALFGGAWVIVPPRWSFQIDINGESAILTFASAAVLTITLAARSSQRRATPPPTESNA
jgi:K+-sensing histidine kinase KdpD